MAIKIEEVDDEKKMREILENFICYDNTDSVVFNVRIEGRIVTNDKDMVSSEYCDL